MAIDPSAVWDFAKEVIGAARPDRGRTLATVTRIGADGTVWVTTGDGGEAPASSVAAGVSVGDTVTLEWDGSAMGIRGNVSNPSPAGSVVRRAVERTRSVADAAQRVADAVNQHFFADGHGIHVTEATQEEWDESHTGANVLINSIGQLFRDGLNNLLTLTTENGARALTIWDGLGNTASNVLATFSANGISFADGTSFDIGDSSAYINFDGNGHISIGGNGLTIGGYATDSDVASAISNISVGGRNLLTGTGDYSTKSTTNQTGITVSSDTFGGTKVLVGTWSSGNMDMGRFANAFSISLRPDSDYTLSFWAKATAAVSVVSYLFTPSTVVSGENSSGNTTTVSDGTITTTLSTEWERYWVTWHTSTAASQATQVIAARVGTSASGQTVYLAGVKFEQGNKATDWSPAPEDVDSAISDAAKTATSYVTEITGQNGIMVHPSTDQTTGVQITSDVDILRDGHNVLNVGTQGDTSGNTDAGVTIYDGTANENVVATFAGDGIGLAGDAFHLTSTKTTSQSGVEHVTSDMSMDSANSSYKVSSYINTDTYLSDQMTDLLGQMRLGLTTGDSTFSDTYEAPSINMYANADTSSMAAGADSVSVIAYDQIELVSDQYVMEGVNGTSNTWSVPAGTVIWSSGSSGGWQMAANVTATLDYNMSACPSGVILHWQAYANSATQDYDHVYTFIPKQHVVVSSGKGVVCQLANSNFGYVGTKYVYVANGGITGHANNTATGTANGITYANNHWVLTQVIAV